jgi:predicted  nucleic acid-binding Zn-ribbon protein
MAGDTKIQISTELLRTLHRLHRQLADLRSQRDRGPLQINASQARVTKAQQEVENIKAEQKQIKIVSDQKQLQLREREDRVKELSTKLNSAASNREFSTLQEQIAADKQANEVQSDEVLETLEQLDVIAEKLDVTESALAEETQQHEQRVQEVQKRQEVVQGNLTRVESELQQAESQLPSAVKGDYRRIADAKGEEGLAAVEDESCTACYQRLTTQYIERLRMSTLVRCPNCDAFLYFPEDRRVT